jgi:hypothetical protein
MSTIKDYKDKHNGRCYILGNGPSLADVDLHNLDAPTFGTNRIYLADYTPDYYVCVNPLVYEQFHEDIDEIETVKFLSKKFENLALPELEYIYGSTFMLDTDTNQPGFYSPEESMWEGNTVTFVCLQLAYYMGFTEVILLGVDHDFGGYKQPHLEAVATGPDENHFHPDYFSNGTRWNYPDLAGSEYAYMLAKIAFEQVGRTIINATNRTKLEVFNVEPLNILTDRIEPPRVSAIVSAYNAEDYLRGCLVDLMSQSEQPEIVVVCQEGSPEHIIFDEMIGQGILGTIRTTVDVPTVYKAWNIGIKAARGRYITNANTDDRHHVDAYRIMADILDTQPQYDLVYHPSYVTWIPNQTFEEFEEKYKDTELVQGRVQDEPGIFFWLDYNRAHFSSGCFIGPHPMWRKTLHQKHGYFLDNYKSAGDYEFWMRISKENNMYKLPHVLGLYLARPDGIELRDPMLSAQEAFNSVALHQSHEGAGYTPVGNGFMKVSLGNEWIIASAQEIFEVIDELRLRLSEQEAPADTSKPSDAR